MILKAFSKEFYENLRDIKRRRILFFNGCFDIVHLGHLKLINRVLKLKSLGYTVICGINSDESVNLQNKSHPLVNDEMSRAEFLEQLGIEVVIIFDEPTPKMLLMNLVPDKVIKGDEYKLKDFDEKKYLTSINASIEYFGHINGYSTTGIYNKIAGQVKKEIRESIQ